MMLAGVLLYTENILGLHFVKGLLSLIHINYDLESAVPAFGKLKNFIYAINVGLSPIILVFASRMHPHNKAYIVPIYAYLQMLVGTIIIAKGYEIFDIWSYRIAVFFGAILVLWLLTKIMKYYDCVGKEDEIKNLIIKNYIAQIEDEAA